MLNLYLTPRSAGLCPSEEAINSVLQFLNQHDLIGEEVDGAFSPGMEVAEWFNLDARDDLLPAELTFESFSVQTRSKPCFLPEAQPGESFVACCKICGDALDGGPLDEALARLGFFPVNRFQYDCPSCRTCLGLKEIDFGQNVAEARFWFFLEGAATSRLKGGLLDILGRKLGSNLLVIPEVPLEFLEDWAPAVRRRRRFS